MDEAAADFFPPDFDERQREILRLRTGVDRGEQRSHGEVAALLGVAVEQVRQVEEKAVEWWLENPSRNDR